MTDETSALLSTLVVDRSRGSPPSASARKLRLLATGAVVAGAAAAIWHWNLLGPRASSAVSQPYAAAPVSAPAPATPAPAARDTGLVASGYVVARRKSAVAAEVTGKVTQLLVDEGSVVREGDVIARLDATLAEKDVSLARSRESAASANADSIAADLADAERVLDRTSQLSQKGFSTAADLSKVEARRNVLRAQLRQATEQILTSRLDVQRNTELLDKYIIRAPFAGVVVERNAEVGELISPTSPGSGLVRNAICTMVDMDSLEIDVDVNEAYIGRVRTGGRVSAVLQSHPDWSIPASVFAFSPMANRDKATVGVRIALTGKDNRVLPGLDVKVTFHDDVALDVPQSQTTEAAAN